MNLQAFGDLFDFIRNGLNIRQRKVVDGIPISRIETISRGIVDPGKVGYAGIKDGEHFHWLLRPGDLLFSHINSVEHIGKCAVYEGAPERLIHGMNLLCLRPKKDLADSRYLVHLIRSPEFRQKIGPYINRAVNQASISMGNLAKIAVSLPPLDEQRRIAAILDQADMVRALRWEAIGRLDELAQSIFVDMFGDPVRNTRGLPVGRIGDFCRDTTGNTPSRAIKGNYGDAIEWIKSDNITTSGLYLTRAVEGLSHDGMKSARIVSPGSLLVTCIAGSPTTIGNVAIVDRTISFNQQINALTPRDTDPIFLYWQLRVGKRLVQEKSTGGMKGLVSKSRLESVELLNPPLAAQQEFAARAAALQQVRQAGVEHLSQTDGLVASLQYRAFRGEL
jgi:type I restriction enzyme S subunit